MSGDRADYPIGVGSSPSGRSSSSPVPTESATPAPTPLPAGPSVLRGFRFAEELPKGAWKGKAGVNRDALTQIWSLAGCALFGADGAGVPMIGVEHAVAAESGTTTSTRQLALFNDIPTATQVASNLNKRLATCGYAKTPLTGEAGIEIWEIGLGASTDLPAEDADYVGVVHAGNAVFVATESFNPDSSAEERLRAGLAANHALVCAVAEGCTQAG